MSTPPARTIPPGLLTNHDQAEGFPITIDDATPSSEAALVSVLADIIIRTCMLQSPQPSATQQRAS